MRPPCEPLLNLVEGSQCDFCVGHESRYLFQLFLNCGTQFLRRPGWSRVSCCLGLLCRAWTWSWQTRPGQPKWTHDLLPVRLDHLLWVLWVFRLRCGGHVAGCLGGRRRHCCCSKLRVVRRRWLHGVGGRACADVGNIFWRVLCGDVSVIGGCGSRNGPS